MVYEIPTQEEAFQVLLIVALVFIVTIISALTISYGLSRLAKARVFTNKYLQWTLYFIVVLLFGLSLTGIIGKFPSVYYAPVAIAAGLLIMGFFVYYTTYFFNRISGFSISNRRESLKEERKKWKGPNYDPQKPYRPIEELLAKRKA